MTSVTASAGVDASIQVATAVGAGVAYKVCAAIGLVSLVYAVFTVRSPEKTAQVVTTEEAGRQSQGACALAQDAQALHAPVLAKAKAAKAAHAAKAAQGVPAVESALQATEA